VIPGEGVTFQKGAWQLAGIRKLNQEDVQYVPVKRVLNAYH
jgi:hypothetical protein